MWNSAHQISAWLVTLQSSCSTCGSSSVSFSNICLFQPRKWSVVFSCGAAPVELMLFGGWWGGSFRQWSTMLWLASVLSKWRNFIWTFPTPNTICIVKEQKLSCDQNHMRTLTDVNVRTQFIWAVFFLQLVLDSLNCLVTSRSHYKEFPQLRLMENLSVRFQLENAFISPVSRTSNKNKCIFHFSAGGWTSTKTSLFQNIVLEPWYSPGIRLCPLRIPPKVYSTLVDPRSLVTLLVATGCKQVWPPAVKLQKTMNASEVQPKFGSIQNQPEKNPKIRHDRSVYF